MARLSLWMVLMLALMVLSGCSTIEGAAYGAKKDADAVWTYMNKEDGWMKKTDNWMQEHLW
jgi:uncharacterized protein YceK